MATVSHYIRSEYDPDVDKNRLLRETGQSTDVDVDPWQTESSSAGFHTSRRLANAPKFVPALLPYDEWGSTAATSARSEPTSNPYGDAASWYRSLSRQGASPTQQGQQPPPQPPSQSDATSHRSPEATPEPSISSSSLTPSITHPASSSSSACYPTTTLSSSAWPAPPPRRQPRAGRDWFIARVLSQSQSSASAPPTPRSNTNTSGSSSSSSLADILSRHPPSAQPLRPPVFLHLGPSNKGWAMLQNQGWSEGEGLGASSSKQPTSLGGNDAPNDTKTDKSRKRTRLVRPSQPLQEEQATEEQEQEVVLVGDDDDDDDPIIEVRKKVHVPIIDLTQSDAEEDEDEEDGEEDDDNTDDNDSSPTFPMGPTTTATTATNPDPRAAQTALLTPLPTVLKSDRLGIGLKSRTEGPYRSSVKRVTHNAAALAAHVKAAEDLRRAQRQLGRGRRAFARAERIEREMRQNMMAYLSEP